MHYRQGSLCRRYVSDIGGLLKMLHTEVCQQLDSADAATKEAERKQYEESVFPKRDFVSAPRVRVQRWQDEQDSPKYRNE